MQEEENIDIKTTKWHDDFSDKVHGIVPDDNQAIDIINETYVIDDIYMCEIREILKQQALQQEKQKQRFDKLEKALEVSKKREAQRQVHMKNLLIIRGYLNRQFRNFWNKYEEKINDKVNLEMLCKYSKRESIYDDVGYKFAVYILDTRNKIQELLNFSLELCKFYILLNEKMHPPISPHSVVVRAIQDIRLAIHEDVYLQREYSITDEVLNNIENFE